MSNPSRSKSVAVAAVSALLLASLAMAGTPAVRHARVKKEADGTVSFQKAARNTNYVSEREVHAEIKDPKGRAEVRALHYGLNVVQEYKGGLLNGKVEVGDSWVDFDVTGSDGLAGFHHTIKLPAKFEVHSAPNNPGAEIDTFATNMNRIEGEGSDSVFEYIRLVGGTANGYPSPGQMTLVSKGDEVEVDSFFNVGFKLEFKGAAGGPFEGIQDAVEATVTMRAHDAASTPSAVKPVRPAKERGSESRQQ